MYVYIYIYIPYNIIYIYILYIYIIWYQDNIGTIYLYNFYVFCFLYYIICSTGTTSHMQLLWVINNYISFKLSS